MRVLLLSLWGPRKGGIVTRVQNLVASSKNEFTILTCRKRGAPPEWNVSRVPCTGMPGIRAGLYVLFGFLRALPMKFDAIHAHYAVPQGVLGVLVKKSRRKPLVTTLHGSDVMVLGRRGIVRPLVKWVIKNSDRVIVVSEALKKRALELGAREESTRVVYAGVSEVRGERKESSKIKVLFIGALVRQKGVDLLLRAFSMLGVPDAELVIVGDGREEVSLEKLALDLGLKGVEFLPPVEDIGAVMSDASLLVLPSREEGFGLVLLEAMARGIPVVASRTGGITEIVEHEKNGLLFKGEDYRALSKEMSRLIKDEGLRDRLTGKARKDAARFSWGKMAREVDEIYAGLA